MSRFSKNHPENSFPIHGSEAHAVKKRTPVPHEFVLEAISSLSPWTRPMFGCLAVYVKEKIVLILRDKPTYAKDNGVWLATTREHHESLRGEFPNMRSIQALGEGVTSWQVLPSEAEDFEEASLHACELVMAGDPRIGKVPGSKRSAKARPVKKREPSKASRKMKKSAKRRPVR